MTRTLDYENWWGDDGDTLFFLLSGAVKVQVQLDGGRIHRLSTVGPGVAFGELAMLDQSRRSADVVATDDSMLARVCTSARCKRSSIAARMTSLP